MNKPHYKGIESLPTPWNSRIVIVCHPFNPSHYYIVSPNEPSINREERERERVPQNHDQQIQQIYIAIFLLSVIILFSFL